MQQFDKRRDVEYSYDDRCVCILWMQRFEERRDAEYSYDDR